MFDKGKCTVYKSVSLHMQACLEDESCQCKRDCTRTRFARFVKLLEVTRKAAVSKLPKILPSIKLEMCRLISMPKIVASTPYTGTQIY